MVFTNYEAWYKCPCTNGSFLYCTFNYHLFNICNVTSTGFFCFVHLSIFILDFYYYTFNYNYDSCISFKTLTKPTILTFNFFN